MSLLSVETCLKSSRSQPDRHACPAYRSPQKTATSTFTSMDLQLHRGSTSTSDAQQPVVASVYLCPEHWSTTSFQSPSSRGVRTVSSLVPCTVLTLLPHYTSAANGNKHPEPPFYSEITSELQLSGSSSSPSDVQGHKGLTLPLSPSDNVQEVQPRKPSDEGLLEEGSIGLMFPKELTEGEPGMEL